MHPFHSTPNGERLQPRPLHAADESSEHLTGRDPAAQAHRVQQQGRGGQGHRCRIRRAQRGRVVHAAQDAQDGDQGGVDDGDRRDGEEQKLGHRHASRGAQ